MRFGPMNSAPVDPTRMGGWLAPQATVRWKAMRQRIVVAMLAFLGCGAAWGADSNADAQAPNGQTGGVPPPEAVAEPQAAAGLQAVEAQTAGQPRAGAEMDGTAAPEGIAEPRAAAEPQGAPESEAAAEPQAAAESMDQSGQRLWIADAWSSCTALPEAESSPMGSGLFTLPSCLFGKIFKPCAAECGRDKAVSLAILVVCFAMLTQQTAKGYRKHTRLSVVLFLILLLGTTVFSVFDFVSGSSGPRLPQLLEFAYTLFTSAFFAGVLAFWTKYMLDLLAVIAAAALVALLVHSMGLPGTIGMPVIVGTGVGGGVWLYWWREYRQKPVPADG